jgi:type II secretory pathway component PulM
MTVLLVLAVVYLAIANWVHRRRVRQLQCLVIEQQLLLQKQQMLSEGASLEAEGTDAPTVTYTLN